MFRRWIHSGESPLSEPLPLASPSRLAAIALLGGGFILSVLAAQYVRQTNQQMAQSWLHDHAAQIERMMSTRIEGYSDALIHTRALFSATGSVDAKILHRYLSDVHVLEKYPGTLGIGFLARVQARDLPGFVRKMRRTTPGFHVWPPHVSKEYFPITFYEPSSPENQRVIGYDTSVWPDRHEAQLRAVLENEPTATDKIILVRDRGEQNSPGFVLFLPIFRPGAPIHTPEQRSRALIGLVNTVFRIKIFLGAVLGSTTAGSDIWFDIYDGENTSPGSLLFSQHPGPRPGSGAHRLDRVIVGGRPWTLDFYTGPGFGNFWSRQGHWIVMISGTLLSLLFFVFLRAAQRRAETERELHAKLRQALDARDEFISIAAHELRTPITSLRLQFDMIRRYGMADPVKSLGRISNLGQQQVRRLTDLINELLDVTRIQSGRLRMNPRSTDLNCIVRDLVEHYRESVDPSGTRLVLCDGDGPVLADVDPLRLGQAVENLLSNALKYGGTRPIQLQVTRSGEHGVIQVRDFGIGIPSDVQDRIFRRFERAVDSPDTVGGLGLGLYIAKQIVDAHHGMISVKSAPGEGSTFSIEVPLADHAYGA